MYRHRTPSPLEALPPRGGTARQREQLDELWAMTPAERVSAMRDGRLSLFQLARWSARHPDQVPLLNGEFEWLAAHTPEAPRPTTMTPGPEPSPPRDVEPRIPVVLVYEQTAIPPGMTIDEYRRLRSSQNTRRSWLRSLLQRRKASGS